jgi:hypothetical protein
MTGTDQRAVKKFSLNPKSRFLCNHIFETNDEDHPLAYGGRKELFYTTNDPKEKDGIT